MKRISLLMIALSFFAFVGVAKAQQTLTVHDGTATNRYVPFYGYWADATQQNQMIYPASDFPGAMVGGQISQMVFYIDPSQGNTYGSGVGDWVVSLGTTDATTLSGLDTSTELTEVFSGNLDAVIVDNTMTITFSQNFIYPGGNLLVEFNHPNASSYKDYYFFGEEVTGAAYTYNAARNFLPKTTFSYTPGSGDPVVVESIEADDVTVGTGHTAQINYTVLPADAWYKQVSFASANTSIATVNQDGLVTGVAAGETTITITSVEYPTISTTINVTVEQTYEITIGEGSSTSSELPLNMYYNYSLTEQLYTAQEIGVGACYINSVAFKLVSGTASKTYALDVYMLNTDKTSITNQDYVNVTAGDLVFSGGVNFTTGDWTTIQFTTPFTYTGGNVLLVVDNNTGSYDGSSRNFAVFSATQQALYQRSDQTNFDPTNISNISSASYKNQVIFGYSPIGDLTPVTGITVTPATMDLIVGETGTINYTIEPEDAFNQNVNYSVEQEGNYISVNNGIVTALAAGTATVTVTTVDGGFTGTCVVTVSNQAVTEITAQDVTVLQTKTAQIEYTVLPANATITDVTFISADESIATVSATGVVTGVAVGETTITIASVSNPEVTATINVTVEYFPTLNEALNVNGGTLEFSNNSDYPWIVEIDGDRIYAMSGNGGVSSSVSTLTLVVNAAEGDALSFDFKAWGEGSGTIYDHCIFSVDDDPQFDYGAYQNDWETYNLVFTAGEHTLTWTFTKDSSVNGTGDYFAIDNVTYVPIIVTPVESITADDITMMTGETAQITPTVLPADANQAVTYASANTSIATVSEDGLVTAVAAGTTTITITSVSTPEVSTTINVTVNSNPDNVVFTVNAPATAQPGDVITVEAYLNAPASGNYNGFTGLVLGLHFDTEAFAVNGDPVKGPVAEACTMAMPALPNESHPDLVQMSCVMPVGTPNPTTGLVFSMQFTVLAETGSYDFYAEPTWASETVSNFVCRLSMDEAAVNIPYEVTPSTVAVGVQTITLDITGYGESDGGYCLIASPIGEVSPANVGGMLDNEYDLYYFDQAQDLEWINYKANPFNMTRGKGYLYANQEDVTLTFTGTPYSGDGTVELVYDDNAVDFKGWNLVGNPFNETAYIADGRAFYTMNTDGSEIEAATSTSIEAMEGIFVIAEEDGETMTFSTEPIQTKGQIVLNITQKRGNSIDRAIVRFEGNTLPKIMLNEHNTKVYIPNDGEDFAVVRSKKSGKLPVNFEPAENGTYTINVNPENLNMKYLHLIDNQTGADIDLLRTPSYSFESNTTDYVDRFVLEFKVAVTPFHHFAVKDDASFGFYSNGEWIINNEGDAILQVVDVNGQIMSNEEINGSVSKHIDAAPGVYMLRLIKGKDIMVQKIVIK